MHAAAVVLLIYQRTRNVWRRLWEVESGQMSAPGQVSVAASQLLLTLTILSPLPPLVLNCGPEKHELIHLHPLLCSQIRKTHLLARLVSAPGFS